MGGGRSLEDGGVWERLGWRNVSRLTVGFNVSGLDSVLTHAASGCKEICQ